MDITPRRRLLSWCPQVRASAGMLALIGSRHVTTAIATSADTGAGKQAELLRYLGIMHKINLAQKLSAFQDHWSPKIVGELNGQHVKLVKFQGEFVWHHHDAEDELFLVVHGSFRMHYKDAAGAERSMELDEGEFVIVPRGTEHRPVALAEVHVMLLEPAGALNTGNVRDTLTADNLQHM
jgi:mannose-6-phosphate isomerase-like protein (cupin superfamily)